MSTPPYSATKEIVIVFNGQHWERHRKWKLRTGYGNEAPGYQWRVCKETHNFRGEAITACHQNADEIVFFQEMPEPQVTATFPAYFVIKRFNHYLECVNGNYESFIYSDDMEKAIKFTSKSAADEMKFKVGDSCCSVSAVFA